MKKLLSLFVLLTCAAGVSADGFAWLTFRLADGSETSLSVENLSFSITNGQLIATNAAGSTTFVLSSLNEMHFSDEATSIARVATESESPIRLFSTEGIALGEYANLQAARQAVPRGIYIAKSGHRTFKFIKR